jgi:glycerol-3-phosphate acyltransferase PlsX
VRYPRIRFMFFGKEDAIAAVLERFKRLKSVSTIHNAEEVIADDDKPVQALRRRRGSSMRLAIDLQKLGRLGRSRLSKGQPPCFHMHPLRVRNGSVH